MTSYYLSLGSNLADRESHIQFGLDRLNAMGLIGRRSSLYETKPVGNTDQPDFLNVAVEFRTELSPEKLLDAIMEIEQAAGRDLSAPRWSARPLDIDILLCGDFQMTTPRLTVPHPLMLDRAFVLAPLAEIAPGVIVPGSGKTCGEIWTAWRAAHPEHSIGQHTHAGIN